MNPIDTFLNKLDAPQKAELSRIRRIVHQTVPDAKEMISYGMPGFSYKHKYLAGFSAFKNHLSLFPTSGPIEALGEKLADFKISKGTIQFTVEKPLPDAIITEILLWRVADISKAEK